jgi:hypothetical protein
VDPITIMAAATAAFGSSALGELAKRSVGYAWDEIKKSAQQRLGSSSNVPALMDELRAAPPGSPGASRATEQLSAVHLERYPEIVAAINRLSTALKHEGIPISPVTINAAKIVGAAVNNGTLNMTFNRDE